MNTMNIQQIMKYLKKASEAYYNNEPIITDSEFDLLRSKLKELDPSNSFLAEVGSPILNGTTHTHRTTMGSLEKVKTEENISALNKALTEAKEDNSKLSKQIDDYLDLKEHYSNLRKQGII